MSLMTGDSLPDADYLPTGQRAEQCHRLAHQQGLRGEDNIAELCRRERIAQNLYYRWSKDLLEAGKKRLAGDTARATTSGRGQRPATRDYGAQGGGRRSNPGKLFAQKSVTADGEDGE